MLLFFVFLALFFTIYLLIDGNTKNPLYIEQGEDDAIDYVDMMFTITGVTHPDSKKMIISALNKAGDIGFNVVVVKDETLILSLVSLGLKSDIFINYLARRFNIRSSILHMKKKVSFSCVVLGGEKYEVMKKPVFLKLFYIKNFDDQEEEKRFMENEYFEIYLNINIQNNTVEIKEKDFSYRKRIIKALMA